MQPAEHGKQRAGEKKDRSGEKDGMTLNELEIGQEADVTIVGGSGELRQHFLDMGIIPGASITLVKYAPMGDPIEFRIHDYELTLRLDDAKHIEIDSAAVRRWAPEKTGQSGAEMKTDTRHYADHPGLGEGGKYHVKADEHPLPDDRMLTFALAGNQNCGKTTLFNQLTGSNQHVGNFPGVTVDRKSGAIKGHSNTEITDLPGIYSMSPYSEEEIVTRQYIIGDKPTGIINIVDATNIERNLYLTMQLMELDTPMVLALNMMDELAGNGGSIRVNDMEAMLGIPVVPISAAKGEGIDELVRHALHVAHYQERPGRQDFCSPEDHGGAVHRCLHAIMHLIEDHAQNAGIPLRFAATKLVEGDRRVLEALNLDQNEKEMVEHIIVQMEKERGLDRAAAIADMRFSFIQKLVNATVVKPKESREHERSRKIDQVLTGRYTAIPMFILIMGLVFYLTFNVIGLFLQNLLASGIDSLSHMADAAMTDAHVTAWIHSLVIDGVFTGVGSVLSFLPIIVTLFFFLSILEDTGYMARIAFVMDKWLRKIGLSGRSIVPMLVGFGCSVPAVMSSRTLPSDRDRKLTVMLIPFMSCSAKVPIYGFFATAFFPKYAGLIMVALYILGIAIGILVAKISKATLFKGEAAPFVMELPNYRLPSPRNVAQLLWDKARDFLTRAFTIIFTATIVIWFLENFGSHLQIVQNSENSILAAISSLITPIFRPCGFANWKITVALICGFTAKESVVSTLNVLFGSMAGLHAVLSPAGAASLLVFCLLYTPCVAAVSSIRRELGHRWALGIVLFQCGIAWVCAALTFAVASLI